MTRGLSVVGLLALIATVVACPVRRPPTNDPFAGPPQLGPIPPDVANAAVTLDAGAADIALSDAALPAPDAAPSPDAAPAPPRDHDPRKVYLLRPGLALPYPLKRVIRALGRCRRGRRTHKAIDIAGLGPNLGLGTPVRAMVRSKVVFIGRSRKDSRQFGRVDRRSGRTRRKGRSLPRSADIPGYGRVYFFTRNHGSWRSGNVLVTRGLQGRLKGHAIRYMHLAAFHPRLETGTILEPGDELGLLGCTAIQRDIPHVHIDIETADKQRVDVAPLLGLASPGIPCR